MNYFTVLNRRTLFLTDRIAERKANGQSVPTFDVVEREALIWAVEKIRELAGRLLESGREPDFDNEIQRLQARILQLEAENRNLKHSNERYKRKLRKA